MMKSFKPFKKNNKYKSDKERFERKDSSTFKTFDRDGPKKFKNSSPRTFGSKESRSGNGFKLHEAVCDNCGRKCDLPFEPTGNKPIYCRSCFRAKGSDAFSERKSDRSFDRELKGESSNNDLEKINRKLDKIMRALNIE